MVFMTGTKGTMYIVGFAYNATNAQGYTKRLTRTLMWIIGYSLGNILAPQIAFNLKHSPMNHIKNNKAKSGFVPSGKNLLCGFRTDLARI